MCKGHWFVRVHPMDHPVHGRVEFASRLGRVVAMHLTDPNGEELCLSHPAEIAFWIKGHQQ